MMMLMMIADDDYYATTIDCFGFMESSSFHPASSRSLGETVADPNSIESNASTRPSHLFYSVAIISESEPFGNESTTPIVKTDRF
jgi:hypothetical protein